MQINRAGFTPGPAREHHGKIYGIIVMLAATDVTFPSVAALNTSFFRISTMHFSHVPFVCVFVFIFTAFTVPSAFTVRVTP